jgi:transcriptional regulator GlxA family with amidase domain
MRTSSRTVAVLLFDELEALDVAGPVQVLTLAGRNWNFRPYKILPAAAEPRLVETRNQLRLEARQSFEELPSPEIVVVPGGYGARKALSDDKVVGWLKRAVGSATHVVGIGNGVLLLAKTGALGGADVSVNAETTEALLALEPSARVDTASHFRESGKCLTARTASGGMAAALRLVESHLGGKQAAGVADALGIVWSPATAPVRILG